MAYADEIYAGLKEKLKVIMDDREQYKPGYKFAEWELQGIPIRIEIGPRDVEKGQLVLVRRDNMEKQFISRDGIVERVQDELVHMQKDMLQKALDFRKANTFNVDQYDELKNIVNSDGGFVNAHWCGGAECETKVKNETKATIRCIPFERENEEGACIVCGKQSDGRVIFAKAY